jgi:hypothetical protein
MHSFGEQPASLDRVGFLLQASVPTPCHVPGQYFALGKVYQYRPSFPMASGPKPDLALKEGVPFTLLTRATLGNPEGLCLDVSID